MTRWPDRPTTHAIPPGNSTFWDTVWKERWLLEQWQQTAATRHVLPEASRHLWWWVVPETETEWKHFPAWFARVLMPSNRPQPAIADLGLWHDLVHAITLPTGIVETFEEWRTRMRVNEILVSLETEVLVYARWPALRYSTFPHPIWADDWDDKPFCAAWQDEPLEQVLWEEAQRVGPALPLPPNWSQGDFQRLWWSRRRSSRSPRPGFPEDCRVSEYEQSSAHFYDAWADDWRTAEWERHADALGVAAGQVAQVMAAQRHRWSRETPCPSRVPGNDSLAFLVWEWAN